MKTTPMARNRCISAVIFCSLAIAVEAQELQLPARILGQTYSSRIDMLISDPVSNTIYAADSGNRRIVVINAERESVASVSLNSDVRDLAFTKGNARYLAAAGSGGIFIFDLTTDIFKTAPRLLPLPADLAGKSISSIAFDNFGNLFVTTSTTWDWVYRLDGVNGQLLGKLPYRFYSSPLVRTNPRGDVVYVGERGLSPATIYRFAGSAFAFTGSTPHGSIGSNLKDFAVSPASDELMVACGAPYAIQRVNASTLKLLSTYSTGPYPTATAITATGMLYGTPDNSYGRFLYQFDLSTGANKTFPLAAVPGVYNSSAQARGLAVSRNRTKAFVVVGDQYSNRVVIEAVDVGILVCM